MQKKNIQCDISDHFQLPFPSCFNWEDRSAITFTTLRLHL
jgi:hypothetical protein